MITLDSIPRDASGLVKGEFYLRYVSESFNESIGRVQFRNGRSVNKVGGRDLLRIVAAIGPDLTFEKERKGLRKPAPVTAPAFTPTQAAEAIVPPPVDHKDFVADLEALPRVEAFPAVETRPTGVVTMVEKPRRQRPGANR